MSDSGSSDGRRREPRVMPEGVTIAIRRRGLLEWPGFQSCRFISISRGGIGVLVDDWPVPTGGRVKLRLRYHGNDFVANGIVAHRSYQENACKYGVIFTSVSYELDRLIDFFLQQSPAAKEQAGVQTSQRQLRKTPRFPLKNLYASIQTPTWFGWKSRRQCQINDISSSGISFYSPVPISSRVPFRARVELAVNAAPYRADGVVNHYRITAHGYCYGLQFLQVSPGLSRAIDVLQPTEDSPSSLMLE